MSPIVVPASLRTRFAMSEASFEPIEATLPASVAYSEVAFCDEIAEHIERVVELVAGSEIVYQLQVLLVAMLQKGQHLDLGSASSP